MNEMQTIKGKVSRIHQHYWDMLDEAVCFGDLDEAHEYAEALYELEEIIEALDA